MPRCLAQRITVLTFDHDPSSGFVTVNELCSFFRGEIIPFLEGGCTGIQKSIDTGIE
jgi:hypothetical protein